MKQFFPLLILSMLVISCSNQSSDQTLAFIPGTYVRTGASEFGRIDDTISIQIQNIHVHSFLIERRWLYKRVLDGVKQEPEYRRTLDQGLYDPQTKLLQNQKNLRLYSFDIKKGILYNNTTVYHKLK